MCAKLEIRILKREAGGYPVECRLKQNSHILHLIAHGTFSQRQGEASLYLADEAGKVCLVKASQFAEMIGQLAQPPQLVYLSSCELAYPRMDWSEFCPLADLSI